MARSNEYKYMNEEFIGPALLCIICRKPFKDPRRTRCNHIFCCECITRWMEGSGSLCFACRMPVSVAGLSPVSDTLNNLLDKLRVKCLLCGQANLRRGNFDDHISKACPNARASLLSANIQHLLIGQQNQFNNHLLMCLVQPTPSLFSELIAENRQLKEQCQQQLSQIQKYQTENQRQNIEIERVDQRCNQHEILINDLRERIAGRELSTARFLSKQPLSSEEKSYYEECKEYYHLTKQPLISVADDVFDNNTEISSSSIKFGIDEDCKKFDLQDFLSKFCDKLDLRINDIVVKQIQIGSAILETQIYDEFEPNDKKVRLKMIYHKLTDKLRKELAKMKIFFMFMGPIKALKKMQKHRAEIKLNPQYNRIYARGYLYWQGPINDGTDRGDKPYYCPVGWQRSSLYVTDNFDEKFKGWCICYHGTKFAYGLSILLSGLKPAKIDVHGAGIYTTPSINYAAHPRYAEVKLLPSSPRPKFFKSGKYIQYVLECRVHPSNIKTIAKETLGAKDTTIDSNINNQIIEWLINTHKKSIVDFNDPDSSIICTGLLTRVTDEHPGLLPESQWWYESHLCNKPKCCLLSIDLDSLREQKESGKKCNIIFN